MDKKEIDNWKKVKETLEKNGKTDNFFYTRAVAILAGNKDPLNLDSLES